MTDVTFFASKSSLLAKTLLKGLASKRK